MEDRIGRKLALTAKALRESFESRLSEAGTTLPTFMILEQLAGEDGLSQRELAGRVHIEAPTLTRHLDRLDAEGLVRRRPDRADRRVTRVELTEAGRRRHREVAQVVDGLEARLRGLLSAREVATLSRVLDRLHAHVRSLAADDRAS
jgi:MarR family transcriptional regulator for hemolysin